MTPGMIKSVCKCDLVFTPKDDSKSVFGVMKILVLCLKLKASETQGESQKTTSTGSRHQSFSLEPEDAG